MRAAPGQAWRLVYTRSPTLASAAAKTGSVAYTVFPSLSNPRLFVDDMGWKWVWPLARPTRRSRSVPWRALALLARARPIRRLLPCMIVPRDHHRQFIEDLIGSSIRSMSFLLGSDGPERKLVAQIVTDDRVSGYLKIADDSTGRWLLRNERAVLEGISGEFNDLGPAVKAYVEEAGLTYLYTSEVSGGRAPTRITETHATFLRSLIGGSRVAFEGTDPFARIEAATHLNPQFQRLWEAARPYADPLEFHSAIIQGDFAPWNILRHGPSMRAVDWEYGAVLGIAGVDAVHFYTNVALLLRKWTAARAADELERHIVGASTLPGFSELYVEGERRAVAILALLFDVATGLVATDGVVSPTNATKLLIVARLLK